MASNKGEKDKGKAARSLSETAGKPGAKKAKKKRTNPKAKPAK